MMKKWLTWALVFLVAFLPVFEHTSITARADVTIEDNTATSAPLPTRAEGTEITDNSAICAMANVLTWEMLQTYLYAITGQQAYDIYANNEENSQALYSDFADFCQETSYGAQVSFQLNKNSAIVAYTTLSQAINYYKTAEDSKINEIKQEFWLAWQTIMNGGIEPQPSVTPSLQQYLDKNKDDIEMIGNSALTYYIGQYITKLVNGERGEVSETFQNALGIPDYYFDGEYVLDSEGRIYIKSSEKSFCYLSSGTFGWQYSSFAQDFIYDTTKYYGIGYDNLQNARIALYLDKDLAVYNSTSYGDYYLGRLVVSGLENVGNHESNDILKLKHYFTTSTNEMTIKDNHIYINANKVQEISNVPVYDNESDLNEFLQTGDYSKCLNYFKAEVAKPSDWLNYDFSQLADKLDQILAALTTLPTITTDDLAGFAQGVGNAISVGSVPASEPATQQQQMQQILEENARNVATKSMADAVTNSDTEEEYTDDNPRPTKTAEKIEKDATTQNAKMVVDLHEFFPFCVPYDMVRLIKVLNAEPQTPCYEGAIKYDKLNINVPVKIDLTQFDDVAKVFRICETALFILALILVTRDLIRG